MKAFKKLLVYAGLIILVALPLLAVTNTQAIGDWFKLHNYTPPPAIASLAGLDTMTSRATHLLYINHPQLVSDKTQFRQDCPQAEQTIVLGCYHSIEAGIAIYEVTDPRLSGVQEVTTAHEMLHAAYDRLSPGDKSNINNLLTDYYNNDLHDQRIIDTINNYKKTEPHDVVDEMHSVFGTEVANLPAPLENYYKRYFTQRQAVVHFSTEYESVFTQNQNQLSSLKNQIDSLKGQVNSQKQDIQTQEDNLAAQNHQMQSLLAAGSDNAYNSQVDSYNVQVRNLKAEIAAYNNKIDQINNLVNQYNQLAYTQESLYNSINTSLQTQPAQ